MSCIKPRFSGVGFRVALKTQCRPWNQEGPTAGTELLLVSGFRVWGLGFRV